MELRLWTQRLLDALRHDHAFADVASDQQDEGLQMAIRDRSRGGRALRRHDERDRQHAVRRIRPAADRHGVFAADAIPRGARGRSVISHRCVGARSDLRHRGERTGGEQRRRSERCRRGIPCGIGADSVVHLRACRTAAGTVGDHPPGAVSVRHHLVQPAAGRCAGPGGGRTASRRTRASVCPTRSPPASPVPPPNSPHRCRARSC